MRAAAREAKRAAVPCLRNLASFVSNQGRYVDAEVLLVSREERERYVVRYVEGGQLPSVL